MAGGKSGYKQETVILNDYSGSSISRRKRTNLKGKTTNRVSFEIKSEPIVHTFDDEALGMGPAVALKEILSEQIKGIMQVASRETLRRRKSAKLNFGHPSKSDKKRYTGGRIGAKKPDQTVRLFNDSGRLADGLSVRKNRQAAGERDWVVNVPINRFTDDTADLAKQLASLVPAIGQPQTLRGNPKLAAAVNESIGLLIAKAKDASDAKRLQLKQARLNAARAAFGLAKTLAGL